MVKDFLFCFLFFENWVGLVSLRTCLAMPLLHGCIHSIARHFPFSSQQCRGIKLIFKILWINFIASRKREKKPTLCKYYHIITLYYYYEWCEWSFWYCHYLWFSWYSNAFWVLSLLTTRKKFSKKATLLWNLCSKKHNFTILTGTTIW